MKIICELGTLQRASVAITANVLPSLLILDNLKLLALRSSEASVLKRATRRNIPEDGIPHSHRRENLKSQPHRQQT
jgi:hypothetical protein